MRYAICVKANLKKLKKKFRQAQQAQISFFSSFFFFSFLRHNYAQSTTPDSPISSTRLIGVEPNCPTFEPPNLSFGRRVISTTSHPITLLPASVGSPHHVLQNLTDLRHLAITVGCRRAEMNSSRWIFGIFVDQFKIRTFYQEMDNTTRLKRSKRIRLT